MDYEIRVDALKCLGDELAEGLKKVLEARGLENRVFVRIWEFVADDTAHTPDPAIDVSVKKDNEKNFTTGYFPFSRRDYHINQVIDKIEEIDSELKG